MSINIPIDLTINTVVGTELGPWSGDPDQEPEMVPITLLDLVVRDLSNRLYTDAKRETERALHGIDKQVADAVAEAVGPRVQALFEGTALFTPTSRYGEPKGDPKTLMEVVTDAAKKWPAEQSSKDTGFGRDRVTNLQAVIQEGVGRSFEQELRPIIEQAKTQVRAAVQEQASQVLAKTITDLAKNPRL